jgi:hypothetical protein
MKEQASQKVIKSIVFLENVSNIIKWWGGGCSNGNVS